MTTEERLTKIENALLALTEVQARHEMGIRDLITVSRTLVDAQLRADGQIQQLREAQLWADGQIQQLREAQLRADGQIQQLREAQLRTDNQIQLLLEGQQHSDERLNALIDLVDRIVRRNGRESQE